MVRLKLRLWCAEALLRAMLLLPRFSRASILFFSWFAVLASCESRFSSVLFLSMGLTSSQAGIVLAVRPFVALVATPLWSAFADKSGKRDTLMIICATCAFLTFMLYSIVHFGFIHEPWVFSFIMSVRILNSIFSSPVYTMIAASCLDSFSSPIDRRKFGKDRLWGAVSWGSVHVAIGYIVDAMDGSFFILFPAAFISFAGFFTACRCAPQIQSHSLDSKVVTVSVEMAVSKNDEERDTSPLVSKSDGDIPVKDVEEQKQTSSLSLFRILCMASGTVFGSVASVFFFLNLFFINIGTNCVEGLVFMFFKNDLGASSSVLGWSVVVTVIFEIPLMYWAPELLKRFKTGTLIVVAELSYSIRTLIYTLIGSNTWILLLVEPLHGVTYSLLATSTTEHVASLIKPGLQTSAQSLPGVIGGVASIVGNAGGGWIMQNYGSTVLYRTTSAMVLCSTVLFVCFSAYQNSKLAQKINEASASESSS